MNAPDKIYACYNVEDCERRQLWSTLPLDEVEQVGEYIRKDALLEWAKEMKEQVGLGLNAYDMGEENGKADMLNALIDKLNSM